MGEMNDRVTQLGPLNWDKVIETRQGGEV